MTAVVGNDKRRYLRSSLIRVIREIAELPVARRVSEPLYRHYFRQPYRKGNLYFGVYGTYEEALAQARQLSSDVLQSTYDVSAAAIKYRDEIDSLRPYDYPALFWVEQVLKEGGRRVFDLGGNLGLAYYGYRAYIAYPHDMVWRVHDLPQVVAAGRALASERGHAGALQFCELPLDADGSDLLLISGTLQYLDYRLPDLVDRLREPPRHILFNITPLHPARSFFTLQNLGIAICPYRVESETGLVADMMARGYRVRDHWSVDDRYVRIPFQHGFEVDTYQGYYFRRDSRH